MNLIKRGKILGFDWYFRLGKRTRVDGINSQFQDGDSALFWEFDDVTYREVLDSLCYVQAKHFLPAIYILQASTDRSWHAVCLCKLPWLKALSIAAETPEVDPEYIRLAAYRRHFTLRLTDKGQGAPTPFAYLKGYRAADAVISDFVQGVRYGAWQREAGITYA